MRLLSVHGWTLAYDMTNSQTRNAGATEKEMISTIPTGGLNTGKSQDEKER
jgi:hypothetical protein